MNMQSVLFSAIIAASIGAAPTAASLPQPQEEWNCVVEGNQFGGVPVAYPPDKPDGIILGDGGRLVRVDSRGTLVYDIGFGPESGRGETFQPVLIDLDGDGKVEVLNGHKYGYLMALNPEDGEVIWQFDLGGRMEGWQMVNAGDINGDGRPEILTGRLDGWVFCLDNQGKLLWRTKVEEFRHSTPALADINNDGAAEIVFGTATRYVVALDNQGHVLWRTFHPPHHMGRTMPYIGDLDDDGKPEIYTASSMIAPGYGLVSLDGAGQARWVGAKWQKAYNAHAPIRFDDGTKGILICDKGNNIGAYQADGTMRWRTQVSGRGIWTPPSVADLDGDGKYEVIATVRGGAIDGTGYSWYALDTEGNVIAGYVREGQFGGPLIADIDSDGVLEVVMAGMAGSITAYTFGGPATPEAVFTTGYQRPGYPLSVPASNKPNQAEPQKTQIVASLPQARYGNNELEVRLPEGDINRYGVEVTTVRPDGTRQIQLFHTQNGRGAMNPVWPVYGPGKYSVTLRLMDLDTGDVLGVQSLNESVKNVVQPVADAAYATIKTIVQTTRRLASDSPKARTALHLRAAGLRANLQNISERIEAAAQLSPAEQDRLAADVSDYLDSLDQAERFTALLVAEVEQGRPAAFAMWQDEDPWDNRDPRDSIPTTGGPLTIETWAFGNEIESVAVNLLNLSDAPLTLRIEPGTMTGPGIEKPAPVEANATLHRTVFLPSVFGEVVPDLLPKLEPSYLIDLAPGEVRQLWININSDGLEPGVYTFTWPVRTLDAASNTMDLSIQFKVSPITIPEKSQFLAGYWSRTQLGDLSTVADLNEHLQTLWYGLHLPTAEADAQGNLIGTLDWSDHDRVLSEAKQVDKILYSGSVPVPTFPDGVEVTDDLKLAGQRNYFNAMLEFLKKYNLDHTNIVFYVEDETGLTGTHVNYLRGAKANKAVDPRVQNYANPWEGITVEMIQDMEPITDVWQPGMETIEFIGPEYVQAMRGPNHKPISTYTPPGNCRILRPLGFFRAQPWMAYHWKIEGGGWWVYNQDDLFATASDREPGYGAVSFDGRALVTSRRWEATRDGVEDFNVLKLLEAKLDEHDDPAARKALEDAVAFVAERTITGMPREAADYDIAFPELEDRRLAIRDALERLSPPN